MRRLLKALLLCVSFFVSSGVFASAKVFCQSELLKKPISMPWSEAIFYNSEFFEVIISKNDQAQLIDKSLGIGKCEMTAAQINCSFSDKKNSTRWSINRITGAYETFYQFENGEQSKTRGRCAKKEQLLF